MTDIEKLAQEIAKECMDAASQLAYPRASITSIITRHLTAWAKERDESVIFHLRQAHEAAFHIGTQFARRNTRQHIEDALRELGEGGSDE